MNRDEIIKVARESGIRIHTTGSPYLAVNCYSAIESEMVAFASRIESRVREECAKKCESLWDLRDDERARMYANKCAAAIRKSEG